jgi:hypothetical protein
VRQFHACYSVGDNEPSGVVRERKTVKNSLVAIRSCRAARPAGQTISLILDNLSAHKFKKIPSLVRQEAVELCFTDLQLMGEPHRVPLRVAARLRAEQLRPRETCGVDPPRPHLARFAQRQARPDPRRRPLLPALRPERTTNHPFDKSRSAQT